MIYRSLTKVTPLLVGILFQTLPLLILSIIIWYIGQRSRFALAVVLTFAWMTLPFWLFRIKPKYYGVFTLIPTLIASVDLSYYYLSGSFLYEGGIYSILDTNHQEVVGFIKNYPYVTTVFFFCIISWVCGNFILYKHSKIGGLKNIKYIIIPLLLFDISFQGSTRFTYPVLRYENLEDIVEEILWRKEFYKEQEFLQQDISVEKNDSEEVHILVIGESLRRDHMGLYGYSRKTTPNLTHSKNNLVIFSNAISASTQTRTSFMMMFSPVNPSYFEDKTSDTYSPNISLVNLMKQINYETHWISNQEEYGYWGNAVTDIAKLSDNVLFTDKTSESVGFDARVLPLFNQQIKKVKQNTFIVVHLLGSHYYYHDRYPGLFNLFNDNIDVYNKDQSMVINAYDNSVRYTDWILSEIAKGVDKETVATITFLADHGESLYDDSKVYSGHGFGSASTGEVEVPLVVWFSPSYIKKYPDRVYAIRQNQHKKVNLKDLYFSYPYISGMKWNDASDEKSFFSKNYIEPEEASILNVDGKTIKYKNLEKSVTQKL